MNHDMIKTVLGDLLREMKLEFSDISINEDDGITRVDITSEMASKIIGWHGETLNSIQHILKAIIRTQEKLDRSPFIVVDVDNYRKDQEDKVCKMAEQKADFVRRTGSRVTLPPMSPYFRRIVHLHVANTSALSDLTTSSSGEGDFRQVVLRLKDESSATEGADDSEELSPVISDDEDDLGNLDV